MSDPLLRLNGLNRAFGGLKAVDDVSFDVAQGSITAVIGPNGAGKTTLFNLISGSLRPDSGEAHFDGRRITGMRMHEIAVAGILRTFQNIRLTPGMTVVENVMLGRHTRTNAGFLASMLRLPWTLREEKLIREKAQELLDFLSLTDFAQSDATALPFGQQRAVEFARALAAEPRLLLLDEPASGLNLRETAELAGSIVKMREMGVTVLLVEHDMSLVMDICEKIIVLNYGRKIATGSPDEVQRNPEVITIYLGEEYAPTEER
jgi:branched-chain amino acid transport system ATP-binding protein